MSTEVVDRTKVTPEHIRPEDIAIAFLVQRFNALPKEALSDLSLLAPEFANCRDPETYREIADTMKEILFPELIGDYHDGRAGSINVTDNLKKRMEWIGSKIRGTRKEVGMTQEQLAEQSGIPQSHISRLEASMHSPSHRTLRRLAKALGVTVGDLDPACPE